MQDKIKEFMENHKVLNLGYMHRGFPNSCALWFANDSDLNLYYLSAPSTQHGTLHRGAPVSFTINRDDQNWKEIRGIQGRGLVFPADSEQGWEAYRKKFPFIQDDSSEIQEVIGEMQLWQVKPNWLRLIDNTVSFGYKEEMKL